METAMSVNTEVMMKDGGLQWHTLGVEKDHDFNRRSDRYPGQYLVSYITWLSDAQKRIIAAAVIIILGERFFPSVGYSLLSQ